MFSDTQCSHLMCSFPVLITLSTDWCTNWCTYRACWLWPHSP